MTARFLYEFSSSDSLGDREKPYFQTSLDLLPPEVHGHVGGSTDRGCAVCSLKRFCDGIIVPDLVSTSMTRRDRSVPDLQSMNDRICTIITCVVGFRAQGSGEGGG